MKKFFLGAVLVILLVAIAVPAFASVTDVKMTIDEQEVIFRSDLGEPFIDANYRTLVPLRGALEAFGATVGWNSADKTATVESLGKVVLVPLNQKYVLVDGVKVENDTIAVEKQGRIYLPIRIVLEAFDAKVDWDYTSSTVVVLTNTGQAFDPTTPEPSTPTPQNPTPSSNELIAMWICYLEFDEMPKDESGFKATIDSMFDKCCSYGMNAVFVQVRPDSDAMYPSQCFPWSKFASGKQGFSPGYDPLVYMIQAAHARGLEFHAWINPYRVTGYKMPWSSVSADNPAKVWLIDNDPTNDRWVLVQNGYYYYNPSVPQVRQLITAGVKEIVDNYDVDGIHFDDYFYPAVSSSSAGWFDKPEYEACGSNMDIATWRRSNVNSLVKSVYSAIKSSDASVDFGISPAGNVANLRSSSGHFVDIDTWMSQQGYVDYIMPQLYWGFDCKTSAGALAPWAFEQNLQTWINLKKTGNVDLMLGLNMGRAGLDIADNNDVSEWLCHHDILKRMVQTGRNSGEVSGYAFFRYDSFLNSYAQQEVNNLVSILK